MSKKQKKTKLFRVICYCKPEPISRSGLSRYAAKQHIELMREKHPKARIERWERA